jgi:hypothetical protein
MKNKHPQKSHTACRAGFAVFSPPVRKRLISWQRKWSDPLQKQGRARVCRENLHTSLRSGSIFPQSLAFEDPSITECQ